MPTVKTVTLQLTVDYLGMIERDPEALGWAIANILRTPDDAKAWEKAKTYGVRRIEPANQFEPFR